MLTTALVLVVLLVLVPLFLVVGLAAFGVHRVRRHFRSAAKARRRAAIRARTGLDTDLLGLLVRDLGRGAGERGRRAGEWITSRLESRYAPVTPAPAAPARDQWLDLDTDLGALQSRVRTAEMLRLSEQLWGRAESGAPTAG